MKSIFKRFSYLLMAALFLLHVGVFAGFQPVYASTPNNTDFNDSTKYHNDSIVVKLETDAQVKLDQSGNFAPKQSETNSKRKADKINKRMSDIRKRSARNMTTTSEKPNEATKRLKSQMESYFVVNIEPSDNVAAVIAQIKGTEGVETAYPVAKPAPSPTVNDYSGMQKYLTDSPVGMGSNFAKTFPGGTGKGVRLVDIEYSWNQSHEDLGKTLWTYVKNGTPVDPYNNTNHGTGVMGTLVGTDNVIGVRGMVGDVTLSRINAYNSERNWDIVGALERAAQITVPGDVVLIEQQTWAPSSLGGYAPVEYEPAIYDAIKSLTASGINVVQAAGNSGNNLDDPAFGTSFPFGKPHSGSIIVGAGSACDNKVYKRERLGFSNYGSRVQLQGMGECVTTTGYGDLEGSGTPNASYTAKFNGTSSASALVAGSVASLSAAHKTLNGGRVFTPSEIGYILIVTGTPQNTEPGAITGNIGPMPNLNRALLVADKTAPNAPTATAMGLWTNNKPWIYWTPSTDNVKVKEYLLYRNGWWVPYTIKSGTNFVDTTAVAGKKYTYKVVAVDTSGNKSVYSNSVTMVSQ